MVPKRLAGPVALTTTLTTNVFNETDTKLKSIVRHIHVVNKTDNDATFSLWMGATGVNAAGTELFSKQKVKARDVFDAYLALPMASTDFIVGGADVTAAALTIVVEGDQEVIL
jgi:hypothetical protein